MWDCAKITYILKCQNSRRPTRTLQIKLSVVETRWCLFKLFCNNPIFSEPLKPDNLLVVDATASMLKISWMFDADKFVFSKYNLLVNGSGPSGIEQLSDNATREFEITGLSHNTYYTISLSTVSGPDSESEPALNSSYTRKYQMFSLHF